MTPKFLATLLDISFQLHAETCTYAIWTKATHIIIPRATKKQNPIKPALLFGFATLPQWSNKTRDVDGGATTS